MGIQRKRGKSLQAYSAKRDFAKSPEPSGHDTRWTPRKSRKSPRTSKTQPRPGVRVARTKAPHRIFVIQLHDARTLHYDFRLEVEGVLVSWAIPKGPSIDPHQKHLAVRTEDHPLEYAAFEGSIPERQYGAGTVIIWDGGTYTNLKRDADGYEVPMEQAIQEGHVVVFLEGRKLRGGFALTRTGVVRGKESWILVKMKDEFARATHEPVDEQPQSILTGKTVEDMAR